VARQLGVPHHSIDLVSAGALLTGSAHTDDRIAIPEGHYTDASMRATVVLNRNMVLLGIATGVAVARGAGAVAFGANAGDHPVYPDCRPQFVEAFTTLARVANEGFIAPGFRVLAPFIDKTKAEIVQIGAALEAAMPAPGPATRAASSTVGYAGRAWSARRRSCWLV
jgi:7-cyano-7-deazaguanine synthase